MQSGISASKELQSAFKSLLSDTSTRGLLVTIESESLVPGSSIPSTSADFSTDLDNLAPLINDKTAAYIILKRDVGEANCVAVTFVPDAAPVRQKMLFASTRLTLVRELGTEHFPESVFATLTSELTASGFKAQKAHDDLAAPLTQEEQDLVHIKEAEAQESTGTQTRKGGHIISGGLAMPVDKEAVAALKQLKAGEVACVQLDIDIGTETIKLASTHSSSEATPSTLGKLISSTSPRYTFYAHPSSSSTSPQVLFVYTCPSTSKIKERMLYASSSRSAVVLAKNEADVEVVKKIEASGPEDVTEEAILDEMEPDRAKSVEGGAQDGAPSKQGFARPKRPGRR